MKLTRLTRSLSAAAVGTLAVSGLAVLALPTHALAAAPNGGQTVTSQITGTITPLGSASYNAADTNCSPGSGTTAGGECVVGPVTGTNVSVTLANVDPQVTVTFAECQGDKTDPAFPEPSGLNGPLQCTTFGEDTTTSDISGNVTNFHFTLHSVTQTQSGGTTICDQTVDPTGAHIAGSNSCTLYVGENLGDFSQPHALFDFDLGPGPATLNAPTGATQSPNPLSLFEGRSGSTTITYGTASDSDGAPEVVTGNSNVVTQPAHGHVTSTSAANFTYTETAGDTFSGTDSFVVAGGTATCGSTEKFGCTPASVTGANITVAVSISSKPTLTITASDATMKFGAASPAITPSFVGFVNGDTSASLTTQPTCSSTGAPTTLPGMYAGADTCSGAVDSNYVIKYVAGNLTVTKANTVLTQVPVGIVSSVLALSTHFSATLTSGVTHKGIAGQTISFHVGGATVCSGVTASNGTATCSNSVIEAVSVLLAGSTTASYGGNADFSGNSVTTPFSLL